MNTKWTKHPVVKACAPLAFVLFIIAVISVPITVLVDDQLETGYTEDQARLLRLLRAAEKGEANYIVYDVPEADPFTLEQRLEYFAACGYAVVGEDREGGFIVERIGWRNPSTEDSPEDNSGE